LAGDDKVVAIWVLNGKVVAGAVDNETFEDFAKENPGALTILAETESMSSDNVVLARNDMDLALREAIKAALLRMNQTAEGQAILERTKTVSFDDMHQEVATAWAHTRDLYQLIND
jgi:ABC-type phosphate/phosphonate transport system substrate-binding protein